MSEQPSQGAQPSSAAGAQPGPGSLPALPPNRKAQAFWGGMLAGMGVAIGLAFVMHVVQQASPIGYEMNINGSVWLVLLVAGPIIGLGLGSGLAASAPEMKKAADSATPPRARPTDQPSDPSA
jgi:hypothetical protein